MNQFVPKRVSVDNAQPLLLRPAAAAKVLSISERSLWSHTAPRGPIPCVRLGKSVLYSVAALEQYIAANSVQA